MAQLPKLRVRLFCNLKRMPWQMEANQEQVVADFARWFQAELWPWSRLPELYFDPRSLAPQKEDDAAKATACLHAKCILIDDEQAFVTSANLTTAAQSRNIEAGALLRDVSFAKSLRLQFEALINRNLVCRVPDVHWSQPAER
jgi:phosphatidylserine/phosphatidylglycerophosphate/cardiolipin synthase-like enzyme